MLTAGGCRVRPEREAHGPHPACPEPLICSGDQHIWRKFASILRRNGAVSLRGLLRTAEGGRHFRAIQALVGTRSGFTAPHPAPIIRTSEHFHVFSPQA